MMPEIQNGQFKQRVLSPDSGKTLKYPFRNIAEKIHRFTIHMFIQEIRDDIGGKTPPMHPFFSTNKTSAAAMVAVQLGITHPPTRTSNSL